MKSNTIREDKVIKDWLAGRTGSKETQQSYVQSMRWFTEVTGKSPEKLLLEAEKEIKDGLLMRERNIVSYIIKYREFLENKGLAPKTVQTRLAGVFSFYTHYNIQLPVLPRRISQAQMEIKREEIPSKEDIRGLLKCCDPLERAVVLVGVSSGLSVVDISNLKIGDFKKGVDEKSGITTLRLTRTKTNYRFYTFLTPECTEAVKCYLKWRDRFNRNNNPQAINQHIKSKVDSDSGYLFISRMVSNEYLTTNDESLRKLDKKALIAVYDKLSDNAGTLAPPGEYNLCRSHNMRRFFYSAMRNAGMDFKDAEFMLGHKMPGTEKAYHRPDPEKFKSVYSRFMYAVTIEKSADPSEHPSFVQIKQENELLKANDETINELRKEIDALKQLELSRSKIMSDFEAMYSDPEKRGKAVETFYGTPLAKKEDPEMYQRHLTNLQENEEYAGTYKRLVGKKIKEKANDQTLNYLADKFS